MRMRITSAQGGGGVGGGARVVVGGGGARVVVGDGGVVGGARVVVGGGAVVFDVVVGEDVPVPPGVVVADCAIAAVGASIATTAGKAMAARPSDSLSCRREITRSPPPSDPSIS